MNKRRDMSPFGQVFLSGFLTVISEVVINSVGMSLIGIFSVQAHSAIGQRLVLAPPILLNLALIGLAIYFYVKGKAWITLGIVLGMATTFLAIAGCVALFVGSYR